MARVTFGGGIVDARGSVGGTTFSRNAAGSYMRARVKPTDPNTAAQSAQRAIIAAVSSAWRALTSAERSAWSVFATEANQGGLLTPGKSLTGQQWYMRCNAMLALLGGEGIVQGQFARTPPVIPVLPEISIVSGGLFLDAAGDPSESALYDVDGANVTFPSLVDPTDPPSAAYALQVRASGIVSAGKSRPSSASYRDMGFVPYTAGTVTIEEAWTAAYGDEVLLPYLDLTPGTVDDVIVRLQARSIHRGSGLYGSWVTGTADVTIVEV